MATDPKELAQTEVQNKFPEFGNIRTSVNYISLESSNYDPSDGEVVEVVNSEQKGVKMIFTSYEEKAVDGQMVLINDQKALCPVLDLKAVPTDIDYLIKDDIRWNVQNVKTDAANALWTLQVRRKVEA